MPIYEFKCQDCGRLTSVFVKTMGSSYQAQCQHCGGKKLERVVSRFAYRKSEQTILEEYGSEPERLEDYKDPRQIGRRVEREFSERGIELPDEARRMIDAARQGEFPEPLKDV